MSAQPKAINAPPSMRLTCQVLLCLSDRGEDLCASEIAERTGIGRRQVEDAIKQLLKKRKISRVRGPHRDGLSRLPSGGTGYLYQYELEDEPLPDRPTSIRTGVKKRPVNRSAPWSVQYLDAKIRLLERLSNAVGVVDRDLLIGILNDYRRLSRKGDE